MKSQQIDAKKLNYITISPFIVFGTHAYRKGDVITSGANNNSWKQDRCDEKHIILSFVTYYHWKCATLTIARYGLHYLISAYFAFKWRFTCMILKLEVNIWFIVSVKRIIPLLSFSLNQLYLALWNQQNNVIARCNISCRRKWKEISNLNDKSTSTYFFICLCTELKYSMFQ